MSLEPSPFVDVVIQISITERGDNKFRPYKNNCAFSTALLLDPVYYISVLIMFSTKLSWQQIWDFSLVEIMLMRINLVTLQHHTNTNIGSIMKWITIIIMMIFFWQFFNTKFPLKVNGYCERYILFYSNLHYDSFVMFLGQDLPNLENTNCTRIW